MDPSGSGEPPAMTADETADTNEEVARSLLGFSLYDGVEWFLRLHDETDLPVRLLHAISRERYIVSLQRIHSDNAYRAHRGKLREMANHGDTVAAAVAAVDEWAAATNNGTNRSLRSSRSCYLYGEVETPRGLRQERRYQSRAVRDDLPALRAEQAKELELLARRGETTQGPERVTEIYRRFAAVVDVGSDWGVLPAGAASLAAATNSAVALGAAKALHERGRAAAVVTPAPSACCACCFCAEQIRSGAISPVSVFSDMPAAADENDMDKYLRQRHLLDWKDSMLATCQRELLEALNGMGSDLKEVLLQLRARAIARSTVRQRPMTERTLSPSARSVDSISGELTHMDPFNSVSPTPSEILRGSKEPKVSSKGTTNGHHVIRLDETVGIPAGDAAYMQAHAQLAAAYAERPLLPPGAHAAAGAAGTSEPRGGLYASHSIDSALRRPPVAIPESSTAAAALEAQIARYAAANEAAVADLNARLDAVQARAMAVQEPMTAPLERRLEALRGRAEALAGPTRNTPDATVRTSSDSVGGGTPALVACPEGSPVKKGPRLGGAPRTGIPPPAPAPVAVPPPPATTASSSSAAAPPPPTTTPASSLSLSSATASAAGAPRPSAAASLDALGLSPVRPNPHAAAAAAYEAALASARRAAAAGEEEAARDEMRRSLAAQYMAAERAASDIADALQHLRQSPRAKPPSSAEPPSPALSSPRSSSNRHSSSGKATPRALFRVDRGRSHEGTPAPPPRAPPPAHRHVI